MGRGKGPVIICDFDGTITLIDTAEYILDQFAQGDWRAVEGLLEAGTISIEECMKRQFDMVSISRDRMVQELDAVAEPRPGFQELVDHCRSAGVEVVITSAGLDFYIRHFLRKRGWDDHIKVVAPRVTETGTGVRFEFPPKRNAEARNFKEDHVLQYQRSGHRVAYIGDGVSDLWAALTADAALAVSGSKLDRLLSGSGRAHREFTDFFQVLASLSP